MASIKKYISVLSLILLSAQAYATHIRAGEIIARRIDNATRTYEFTFIGYRDNDSGIKFGGGIFDFGDGTTIDGTVQGFNITETRITQNIFRAEFTVRHTYQSNRGFVVSYKEDFRNADIANMDNSINTTFYVETLIIIDPFYGVNNSPILTVPPIDEATPGVSFIHNPGAFDVDGDSLSYEFVVPRQDENETVFNYRELIDPKFYSSYSTGSEEGEIPSLTLDNDGNLEWNAPGDFLNLSGADCQGCAENCAEYNVAFRVVEWKKRFGMYERAGYVTRDMQIIVYEGDNEKPELELPPDACVVAGQTLTQEIVGTDPDGHDVKIEAFGGPFELNSPATYTPGTPPVFQPSPGTIEFNWNTVCGHVRERPYEVQLKISDDPINTDNVCTGPSQVDFQTWQIQVIGPKPTGLQAEVRTGRSISLDWDPYSCPNADSIQIWRRVGDFMIASDSCTVGIPSGTGYELVSSVGIGSNSFLDAGLAPGAKYCYRLVATFPAPGGGESIVSDEVCVTLETDAPVVTNVDIRSTSSSGDIGVRWTPPYEVDSATFPPPYTYSVFRSNGFSGGQLAEIATNVSDTFLVDAGIDTEIRPYSYQINLFDRDGNFVDTSAIASSVRLSATPLLQAIEISWTANVPWSNVVPNRPFHYVYRDRVNNENPDQIVLIDSVDITAGGFRYLDDGRFNDTPLDEELVYCYYIVTQGSYDNEILPEPLLNRSQSICAQPNDEFAPCPPVAIRSANSFDCSAEINALPCNVNVFENVIEWEEELNPSCDDDANYYRIYYSSTGLNEDYILLDSTSEFSYTHTDLSSFKGCYRISAVDRSLNESELTEPFCLDNCPNFELPNAFSPNGDRINDTFTPYYNSNSNSIAGFDNERCPRFIQEVQFKVFDRSGKLVFDLADEQERSTFINWDGSTNDGQELPSGLYYYVAEVTFDVLATTENQKTYKGWVQLLR